VTFFHIVILNNAAMTTCNRGLVFRRIIRRKTVVQFHQAAAVKDLKILRCKIFLRLAMLADSSLPLTITNVFYQIRTDDY